jgi:HSP20 family molecular chaperone IbpA
MPMTASLLLALSASAANPKSQTEQQASIEETLDVVGVNEKDLVVEKEGLVVDIKVDHETVINGSPTRKLRRIEARLDQEFKPGDRVAVRANLMKDYNHALSLRRETTARAPQSGEEVRARAAERITPEPRKLTAKVLGVDEKNLVVDVDGYAIKLHVDHDTLLQGEMTKMDRTIEGRLNREFSLGQQVTVELERYRLENRAITITK